MNIENLKIYRDGFVKLMEQGVITDETFDMRYYRQAKIFDSVYYFDKNDCGTIGCPVGYLPFIFKPVPEDFTETIDKRKVLSFIKMTWRILEGVKMAIWDYLFSRNWFKNFNTPKDFIERLGWLIENHDLPNLENKLYKFLRETSYTANIPSFNN